MVEQTTSSITVNATPSEVMAVVADFKAYPEWTGAVKEAEVLSCYPDGRAAEVRFVVDAGAIKDQYTLAYEWDDDLQARWHLVSGQMLTSLEGSYILAGTENGATHVTYQLAVDVKIPMIGMIKRKAAKVIIDTALNELKKRVETKKPAE